MPIPKLKQYDVAVMCQILKQLMTRVDGVITVRD